MSTRPLFGCGLALAIALAGSSAAHAQKDKDKGTNLPKLAEMKDVKGIEYSPDGSFVLVHHLVPNPKQPNFKISGLGIWDAKTGEHRLTIEDPPRSCERIAISPDGKKVAAITIGSMQLKVWDAATGKVIDSQALPEWKGFILHAPFLKFSADGTTLYSMWSEQLLEAKIGGKNRLFSAKTGRYYSEETAFDTHTNRLIVFNNVLGMQASSLNVYDATKEGEPKKIPLAKHVRWMVLSPDGKMLVLSYLHDFKNSKLEMWDTATWKVRATAPPDARKEFENYRMMSISPDNKWIAGAPHLGTPGDTILNILDADGKVVREVTKPGGVRALGTTFTPDGKALVVLLSNDTLLFLDPATGEEKKP